MAHFAELDENNIVKQVIVVHNNELLDESGQESEQKGIDFCKSIYGEDTKWVQTSYNESFRKNFAGIGFSYDQGLNCFISPKPYPSWTLNEDNCRWMPPVPYPGDGVYKWNEESNSWVSDII